MTIPRLLPIVMTVLSASASVVYFCSGDWKRGLYWLGAVVVNVAVTI